MDTSRKRDEESLYHVAAAKPAAERAAYLKEVCRGDPALLARVMTLLKSREEAGDFLEAPVLGPDTILDEPPVAEGPGTVIGRYKLLERIGEGGMAVVYMAEQAEPIRRKVALKIIKLGMDTKQVIARFEAERQALAMMDHPNIAKVLDAGATETGRPYFVMELVTGVSVTEYCDQNNLSTKERLDLFMQVCNAVQHAHQKGIIHRDIKPSNVMVAHQDGKPVPKVIDFGIAKATNQRLTEKTIFTRYAHIIGTPAYMSPEQAELSDLDIDTRSDIYSLGVLLYELLTGTTPFSEEELRKAGYIEMQRVIREQEPAKPSTKLSTLGETLTDVAKHRNATPDLLAKAVRGDLDWIVMKSLEKDRAHRYETPSALGMDVQRYLSHEAVLARGPGVVYHVQKFLRRRQTEVVVTLAVAIVFGLGVGVLSMWNQDRLQLTEVESLRHRNILSQARELHARGQHVAALEKVNTILHSDHVGPEAQLLYAGVLVEGRQPDEAVTMLEDLLGDRPEIAGAAHSLLARVLWEDLSADAEKLQKVEDHRQRAEELLPKTAEAYFLRAMTAVTIKEKLELLDHALRLDPAHYESRRLRAFTYQASRKYDQMKDDTLAMIVLRPQNALGYSLRATACQKLGRHQEALANYESAIRFIGREEAEYSILAAQCCDVYLGMGDFDRVIVKAQEYLEFASDPVPLEFRILCALTARGDYDEVAARYARIVALNPDTQDKLSDWSKKYVFDTLEAGHSWHPTDSEPPAVAFAGMLEADRHYRALSAKARRLINDGFTARYSPDGKKVAFSTGFHGYSGVALYDVETGQFDLLIAPGKDPVWSPDGCYLAFVRDCQVLSVSDLAGAERANRHRTPEDEEIWMMNADGTNPRRLALGSSPHWSRDPNHIYFHSHRDKMLYKLSVRDGATDPEPVPASPGQLPAISPDERYVAYVVGTSLRIFELASGSLVAEWTAPFTMQGIAWSADSRELCLGAMPLGEIQHGLWIYDLDKKQASRVLEGLVHPSYMTPDGTRLIFNVREPYFEIWVADLDPNVGLVEALGPSQTLEEHFREMVAVYTRRIEADPQNAYAYSSRAQCHDYLGDRASADADMRQWSAVAGGRQPSGLQFGTRPDFRRVLSLPFDYQLVFSAERPVNKIPMMSVALGQKGRLKMKHFKIPTYAASLCGLSLILGLYAQPVQADYEFGAAEKLGPLINSEKYEYFPRLFLGGLSLHVSRDFGPGQETWVFTRPAKDAPWDTGIRKDNLPKEQWTGRIILPGWTTLDGLELYGWGPFDGTYGGFDIYVKARESIDIPWMDCELVNLGPVVNTRDGEGHVTVSSDGLELYFSDYGLHRPGGYGKEDLWVTRRATRLSPWETPENLGPVVNSPAYDSRAHISIDGLLLFFDSQRPGGYGGSDLYVTRRKTLSDPWEQPVNLGQNVNSASDEFHPCISPDGRELYFVRNEDIWRSPIDPIVDLDGNGKVDSRDTSILVDHWLQDEPLCDIGPTPFGDGIVDVEDLLVLAGYLEPGYRCVARWKLDEVEGTAAQDSVGENDGYVFGDATWQSEGGRVDGALELDGVDDYFTTDFVLDPAAAPFRMLAWVKGGAPGQTITAQSPGDSLGSIWLGTDPSDGTLMTELMLPQPALDSDAVITDGQWYEVSLEWDGKRRHLYVDAEEVAADETGKAKIYCDGWLNIGAAGPAQSETFWSGLIDDVRIESRTPKP